MDITYSEVLFSQKSGILINELLSDLGLKKDFKRAFHCTITYSRTVVPDLTTSKGVKQIDGKAENDIFEIAKPIKLGSFLTRRGTSSLHIELDCPFCQEEVLRHIAAGVDRDFPIYNPHITILYDAKDFDIDNPTPSQLTAISEFLNNDLHIVKEKIVPLKSKK